MPFRSRRLTRRTRAGQRERRLPAARVQRAWTWKQQEMTVSTLGYIGDSCIQLVSRTALALPMSTAIDTCPVMQRHAGQTQYDRGQRRHHEPVVRPDHGSSSCLSAAVVTKPQPFAFEPP